MRLIPTLAAVTIGLFAIVTAAPVQAADPGAAPGASSTGGRPAPVDRGEVKRENTTPPTSSPRASTTGGRPQPVDPAEVRRDNTTPPSSAPALKQ
jgi:hypothetical protein